MQIFGNNDLHHAQGQGRISAGVRLNIHVGLVGGLGLVRVHRHQQTPTLFGLVDEGHQVDIG